MNNYNFSIYHTYLLCRQYDLHFSTFSELSDKVRLKTLITMYFLSLFSKLNLAYKILLKSL